ncbi:MAG: CGNR zinc finger domain-containing protein [Gaiellaceae bacterium]
MSPRRRPPRYDLPHAAPEPLRLVQLLLNSRDAEHGREWLSTPKELAAWLDERGLHVLRVTTRDVARVQQIREALREHVMTNNDGGPVSAGAKALLDAEAARATLRVTFEGGLEPALAGIDGALARVFAVVHDAMRDGTWGRLKGCRNCHWAFWDESKNRSATWCSMELCGNRLKTKRYRTKRAVAHD